MAKTHSYTVTLQWTGNTGTGTSGYRDYRRDHEIAAAGKPPIPGSSDAHFRGDAARWNPEELLVAALSACHQLSYLHCCADAGIVVLAYTDRAEGLMEEAPNGSGSLPERHAAPAGHGRGGLRPHSRPRPASLRTRQMLHCKLGGIFRSAANPKSPSPDASQYDERTPMSSGSKPAPKHSESATPTAREFAKLAHEHTLVPVYRSRSPRTWKHPSRPSCA